MTHQEKTQKYCNYALNILGAKKLKFRPMKRKYNRVNTKHGYVIGQTNLKTGLITIDIFTPKKREPKKISSILRTLCHEVAHYQKKPYQERFRGRWITRQHYPSFYRQVKKNIEKLKGDRILKRFFNNNITYKITNKKGFMLIELLVVISIIAFLSTITFTTINNIRANTRDTKRIRDINTIRKAIEMYYDDYGKYPCYSCSSLGEYPDCTGFAGLEYAYSAPCWYDLEEKLSPYISKLPTDPFDNESKPSIFFSLYYYQNKDLELGEGYQMVCSLEKSQEVGNCGWPGQYCIGTNPPGLN